MLKWIKENRIILITMLIFETVAVSLFVSTKKLILFVEFQLYRNLYITWNVLNVA